MQVIVLALLKKTAPYLALVLGGLIAGFYLGHQLGSEGLAAAKLALSEERADDAKVAATANAAAAVELAKSNAHANAAQAALATATQQASAEGTELASQIAAQATQPGQDAPDAPVLARTLDGLEDLK